MGMSRKSLAIIPKAQLTATKKQIRDVVKSTDSDKLHTNYVQLNEFFSVFYEEVKREFLKRAKKNPIETPVGKIQYAIRNNYSVDEKKLKKFLKKNKISIDYAFDESVELVTNNDKVIQKLIEKGHAVKIEKPNFNKINELAEEYPEILDFVENDPTEYIKGL